MPPDIVEDSIVDISQSAFDNILYPFKADVSSTMKPSSLQYQCVKFEAKVFRISPAKVRGIF